MYGVEHKRKKGKRRGKLDADGHRRFTVAIGYGRGKHVGVDGRNNLNNAQLAFYMEKGDPAQNRPPRPFIVNAMHKVNVIKRIINLVVRIDFTYSKLNGLMKEMESECTDYIAKNNVLPPTKQSTLERRKRYPVIYDLETTLYHTGELAQAFKIWRKIRRK